jgi:hypothetical protein
MVRYGTEGPRLDPETVGHQAARGVAADRRRVGLGRAERDDHDHAHGDGAARRVESLCLGRRSRGREKRPGARASGSVVHLPAFEDGRRRRGRRLADVEPHFVDHASFEELAEREFAQGRARVGDLVEPGEALTEKRRWIERSVRRRRQLGAVSILVTGGRRVVRQIDRVGELVLRKRVQYPW